MGRLFLPCLVFWVILVIPFCQMSLVNYEPGYVYWYNYNSTSRLQDVQEFYMRGQVGVLNIDDTRPYYELFLKVLGFTVDAGKYKDVHGDHFNFSQWFSFTLSEHGEVDRVFYPPNEEDYVIIIKKAFVSMLSSKLHHQHEIDHSVDENAWHYNTKEFGRDGMFGANYRVENTHEEHVYTRTRHLPDDHMTVNGNSSSIKTVKVSKDLNTVHSISMEEDFRMSFKQKEGFYPHSGMPSASTEATYDDFGNYLKYIEDPT